MLGPELGSGAYGTVHQCTFHGSNKCAIKRLTKSGSMNVGVINAFKKEVTIMCSLSHPCTIRLYAWIESPPAMIMELAICDLRQYYRGDAKGKLFVRLPALDLQSTL